MFFLVMGSALMLALRELRADFEMYAEASENDDWYDVLDNIDALISEIEPLKAPKK